MCLELFFELSILFYNLFLAPWMIILYYIFLGLYSKRRCRCRHVASPLSIRCSMFCLLERCTFPSAFLKIHILVESDSKTPNSKTFEFKVFHKSYMVYMCCLNASIHLPILNQQYRPSAPQNQLFSIFTWGTWRGTRNLHGLICKQNI